MIPGHDRAGEELVAGELVVEDGPLAFSYRGVCGYGTTFDYSGWRCQALEVVGYWALGVFGRAGG